MAKETIPPTVEHPKFISNRPCGEDKFGGKSQERLAESIAEYFKRNDALPPEDALPRIIGIEGGWGLGKSNVVKLLTDKCSKDYCFFEYDAWGHQEDLQRRSFLELLTEELIQKNILEGDTTIKKKDGTIENVTWGKKLSYLLARKTENEVKTFPRISGGVVVIAAVTILTPIFSYLASAIIPDTCSALWKMLITAIPFIIGLIVLLCKTHGLENKWSYLLAIYQGKVQNDISYETISEDEPTAKEFKEWMNDVSKSIENKEKLVVVFDNMDRLPAEKVKELWSSIHTFFAEARFDNVWAIIPFDQKHLSCAFGDGKTEPEKEQIAQLTSYFIAKTFPIVYRVPSPVITDYKVVFNKLFEEAFEQTENPDKDLINRIYRLEKTEPNVRNIIVFINQLVALRLQWKEQISLINIAVFVLCKEKILENSVETILSGSYLSEKIKRVILNDEERQAQTSALTYGVEIEIARQIPLTKYIQRCINSESEHDINKYVDLKSFDSILEEVVADIDESLLDKAIQCLKDLGRVNKVISKLWHEIAERRIKQPLSKPEFEDAYKVLLLKTDSEHRHKIISHLVNEITKLTEFNGGDYYRALNEIETFLAENKIEGQVVVSDKDVSPQIFIDYVLAAGDNYAKYKMKTDPAGLDSFFVGMMPDQLTAIDIIPVINGRDGYLFDNLLKRIEEEIDHNKVQENNFESIMSCYKSLSSEKPLPKKLSATVVAALLSGFDKKKKEGLDSSGYYDTVAMSLALGVNAGNNEPDTISRVAELMDYYASYGDLLVNCVSWNSSTLNQVLKGMTISGKRETSLAIEKILPQYDNILNRIGVSDEEFLTQLSHWSEEDFKVVTKENIKTIIPSAGFYNKTTETNNDLTAHINKVAVETLSTISAEYLYNQKDNYTSDYWHVAIQALLNTAVMKSLPENVSEFGKRTLADIASGAQTLPLNEYMATIVDKLDRLKTASTIAKIRNWFCVDTTAISAPKFEFLEPWLRAQGDMESYAGDAVDKILKPIIGNTSCHELILANEEFYISLIDKADDRSYEFKQELKRIVADLSSGAALVEFARKIAVVLDSEDNE